MVLLAKFLLNSFYHMHQKGAGRLKITLFGLLITFALAGVTPAATLFSPPLVTEGSHVLDCYLVNVSDQPCQVTIQVFNRDGDIVKTVETVPGPGKEDVARTTSAQLECRRSTCQ